MDGSRYSKMPHRAGHNNFGAQIRDRTWHEWLWSLNLSTAPEKILPPYIVKCRTRALRWNCVASSKNVDSSLTPSFLWLGKLTFKQATSLTSRQIVNGVHFKRWHTLLTYFHHQSIVLSSTHSQNIISGPQCNSFEQVSDRLQTPSTVLPPGKLL